MSKLTLNFWKTLRCLTWLGLITLALMGTSGIAQTQATPEDNVDPSELPSEGLILTNELVKIDQAWLNELADILRQEDIEAAKKFIGETFAAHPDSNEFVLLKNDDFTQNVYVDPIYVFYYNLNKIQRDHRDIFEFVLVNEADQPIMAIPTYFTPQLGRQRMQFFYGTLQATPQFFSSVNWGSRFQIRYSGYEQASISSLNIGLLIPRQKRLTFIRDRNNPEILPALDVAGNIATIEGVGFLPASYQLAIVGVSGVDLYGNGTPMGSDMWFSDLEIAFLRDSLCAAPDCFIGELPMVPMNIGKLHGEWSKSEIEELANSYLELFTNPDYICTEDNPACLENFIMDIATEKALETVLGLSRKEKSIERLNFLIAFLDACMGTQIPQIGSVFGSVSNFIDQFNELIASKGFSVVIPKPKDQLLQYLEENGYTLLENFHMVNKLVTKFQENYAIVFPSIRAEIREKLNEQGYVIEHRNPADKLRTAFHEHGYAFAFPHTYEIKKLIEENTNLGSKESVLNKVLRLTKKAFEYYQYDLNVVLQDYNETYEMLRLAMVNLILFSQQYVFPYLPEDVEIPGEYIPFPPNFMLNVDEGLTVHALPFQVDSKADFSDLYFAATSLPASGAWFTSQIQVIDAGGMAVTNVNSLQARDTLPLKVILADPRFSPAQKRDATYVILFNDLNHNDHFDIFLKEEAVYSMDDFIVLKLDRERKGNFVGEFTIGPRTDTLRDQIAAQVGDSLHLLYLHSASNLDEKMVETLKTRAAARYQTLQQQIDNWSGFNLDLLPYTPGTLKNSVGDGQRLAIFNDKIMQKVADIDLQLGEKAGTFFVWDLMIEWMRTFEYNKSEWIITVGQGQPAQ